MGRVLTIAHRPAARRRSEVSMSADNRHIWRAVGLAVVVVILFFVVRSMMIPASWGETGPYRADALREEAARKPLIPDVADCTSCHGKQVEVHKGGSHATVLCKNCHGVAREHINVCTKAKAAGDPKACVGDASGVTDLKTGWDIKACEHCHMKRVGPPAKFPLIDFAVHLKEQDAKDPKSPSACKQCHQNHSPGEEPDEDKGGDGDDDDGDSAAAPAAAATPAAAPAAAPAAKGTKDNEEADDD